MVFSGPDYAHIRRPNYRFSEKCAVKENFKPQQDCQNAIAPKIPVWGDSFAMHLIPGIVATTKIGVLQATRSVCGPFLGSAPIDKGRYARAWAEQCFAFNQFVLDYLTKTPSIELVVLASPFSQYVDSVEIVTPGWRSLTIVNGRFGEGKASVGLAVQAMKNTIKTIRSLGKKVVLILPPSSSNFNTGACLEHKATGQIFFGTNADCRIPVFDYLNLKSRNIEFLKQIMKEAEAHVIRFNDTLCSNLNRSTEIDGIFLYRDSGHSSYDGSRLVATKMKLGEMLQMDAR